MLRGGKVKERLRLPVEVGLILKDGEHHLLAFVGGLPVFQYTYPIDADDRQIRAASDYMGTNLSRAVFSIVSMLGHEAVELPAYEKRTEVARLWVVVQFEIAHRGLWYTACPAKVIGSAPLVCCYFRGT